MNIFQQIGMAVAIAILGFSSGYFKGKSDEYAVHELATKATETQLKAQKDAFSQIEQSLRSQLQESLDENEADSANIAACLSSNRVRQLNKIR